MVNVRAARLVTADPFEDLDGPYSLILALYHLGPAGHLRYSITPLDPLLAIARDARIATAERVFRRRYLTK